MGCSLTKEQLQTEILVIQLEKAELQEQRERLIYQLEIINRRSRRSLQYLPKNSSFYNKVTSRSETDGSPKSEEIC